MKLSFKVSHVKKVMEEISRQKVRNDTELPIKQESKWIPVSERLPEESGEYLVTYNGIATTLNYSDKYGWYYDDGEHFTQFGDDVTAWMPLPKPYEPQGRSDKE